jgi:hypothetical protein
MPGQMGRCVDHIADEIKPAPFDVAFRQEQSAGMDARMHLQWQKSRRQAVVLHLPNPFVDVESGLCGTPTVVLAGTWVAEDCEGAVTLRSNHAAAVLNHGLMPDLAQFAQELGEVLRLHLPTQTGGPHQVGEKDRQSMTFALGRNSSCAGLCIHHRCGGRAFLHG